ncbi:hypothetical protein Tco_0231063 [Tanacetum coccineum]
MRMVNTFVPIKSEGDRAVFELAAGSLKRDAEEELDQESSKRKKTGESSELAEEPKDKEADELSQEGLQQIMIIVPEQGMNVEALQTKGGMGDGGSSLGLGVWEELGVWGVDGREEGAPKPGDGGSFLKETADTETADEMQRFSKKTP